MSNAYPLSLSPFQDKYGYWGVGFPVDPRVNVRNSKCADGKNELFAEEGKGRGSRMKPSAPVINELTADFTALGEIARSNHRFVS